MAKNTTKYILSAEEVEEIKDIWGYWYNRCVNDDEMSERERCYGKGSMFVAMKIFEFINKPRRRLKGGET